MKMKGKEWRGKQGRCQAGVWRAQGEVDASRPVIGVIKEGEMPRRRLARPGHVHGFTLLEVLLAMVLGGLIITAAAGFLFGVFNLTLVAEKKPLFAEHANNVSRFLEFSFASALPVDSDDSEGDGETISWQRVPGVSGLNPQGLSMRLRGDLPVFQGEESPLPELNCYLVVDGANGLSLVWQSDDMANDNIDAAYRSELSPYVSDLNYLYYDALNDNWESSGDAEKLDDGTLAIPDFIQLTFKHPDGREIERQLILPAKHEERPLP